MQSRDSSRNGKHDPTRQPDAESAERLFAGPGEMHERGRAFDWGSSPLGPVEEWPQALRTIVRVALDSPFPINLWCGPELVLIYNDGYRTILGAKHPAAFGQRGATVWEEVWPQIGPLFDEIRAGVPPVLANDVRFLTRRSPKASEDAAGEPGWFTYSLSAIRDSAGEIVGFLNIVSERTEAVIAQFQAIAERVDTMRALDVAESARARLADVFRQAPALMAVLRGPDHVFTLVNDAYYTTVGKRELIGKPVLEALPEVRGQGFVELLDHVLHTGKPYVGHEVPVKLARWPGSPPEERFITFIYHPLTDPDGTVSAILAHGMDVTEGVRARVQVERLLIDSESARAELERAHSQLLSQQKELELANQRLRDTARQLEMQKEELRTAADQLAERTREADAARRTAVAANRLKSEFLATMSHEFRTPLNAILGYTQLLDLGVLGPATPAQHAHLARLESSARHLLQLVDDVLDVAKVDADRLEVRRDVRESEPVITAAVSLIQPQAVEKGVTVEAPRDTACHVSYLGDEHRVRQILVNLLSNAVKFTERGGRVTITCGQSAEPEPGTQIGARTPSTAGAPEQGGLAWTYIRVTDTGAGINPALMGQLFEPFVQGNGALTREQGGTGLGLAISRRLARLMGGDLTARSQPDAGATFTLWLPMPAHAKEAASPEERGAPASTAPALSGADGRGGELDRLYQKDASVELDDDAYLALQALSARLSADAETVAEHYVSAIRADGDFAGARDLPAVQLRDHATPLIGLIASQLMVIAETRGHDPELLRDSAQAQRLMSELHGAQRYRLGWREEDIERETSYMIAAVESAIVAGEAAAMQAASEAKAGVTPPGRGSRMPVGPHGGVVISAECVSAAASYANKVVHDALEQGMQTSLRAYRFAKAEKAR
ncbi:MAG TPA: PAS domain-containing sensor histidine kinase [Gemmatimonadaceae bacterium]|jgi:Signal transduction histidine kinase